MFDIKEIAVAIDVIAMIQNRLWDTYQSNPTLENLNKLSTMTNHLSELTKFLQKEMGAK